MSRHEKFCKKAPQNKHQCFKHCRFLTKKRVLISPDRDPSSFHSYKTEFKCEGLNKKMYSFLLEKKINFRQEFTRGLKRMPLVCNTFEEMSDSEIELRYNPDPE